MQSISGTKDTSLLDAPHRVSGSAPQSSIGLIFLPWVHIYLFNTGWRRRVDTVLVFNKWKRQADVHSETFMYSSIFLHWYWICWHNWKSLQLANFFSKTTVRCAIYHFLSDKKQTRGITKLKHPKQFSFRE